MTKKKRRRGPGAYSQRDLVRAVNGALRGAIHDHGPITAEWIGSAAKRVVAALETGGYLAGFPAAEQLSEETRLAIWHQQRQHLR